MQKILLCTLASPLPPAVHGVSALPIDQPSPISRNTFPSHKEQRSPSTNKTTQIITFLLDLVRGHMTYHGDP